MSLGIIAPPDVSSTSNKRAKYLARLSVLRQEREPWFQFCKDISDVVCPRNGRFIEGDRSRGGKRYNNIYDNTATRAWRTLGAGLMSGMTSPARPWFRVATPDDELNDADRVKRWLAIVAKRMLNVFAQSNTYQSLHKQYEDHGVFGVATSIIFEDFEDVIRHQVLECGEYFLAADKRGVINTLYRVFNLSVAQLVDEYGLENCSLNVQNKFRSSTNLDEWIEVLHVIEPRADRDPKRSAEARHMPWTSCHLETRCNEGDKYLRESGFPYFPAQASRWIAGGGDVYGTSPAMECLGDSRQLQHQQFRKAQGIDFQVKPSLQIPVSLSGQGVNSLPGGENFVDVASQAQGGIKPAFQSTLNLRDLKEDIMDVRERIREGFYTPLFLMFDEMESRQPVTAREVAERHEEKLLLLGPVLERLHNEMLSPLIEMTFQRMLRSGMLPPPPPELNGMPLNIQFISVLAQAQRAVGLGAVDRLLGTVAQVATVKPDIVDKIDTDELVDRYADMLGVDPLLIVPADGVALIRADRQKQQAAAQAAQAAPAVAQTAKTLADTDTTGTNALTGVMNRLQGYGAQQ